ncbi:MAG TPA: DUF4386 domain-containing protein [Pyrinomonadaceae bacterium]|nr:DUF4386 domain-containing protein [Pyrinomonadaceae bacterium]
MNVQRYARVAGVLFLLSLVAGGFGEAYVPSRLIVGADAAATVANIKNFDFLYRLGFAAFLIESLCDTALALILYVLLKPVNKQLSLLAAFFGLMATATFAFAELFYFAPQLILGRAYLNNFTPDQVNSLALLSLKFYGYAGMIFTAYYGMAWIVRSYLIFRSSYLPKFLSVLMAIGGIGFVVRNFLLILAPAYASDVLLMLMFPGGLIMTVWLLLKGVNVQKWNAKVSAARAS